jgi:hypothetical protein
LVNAAGRKSRSLSSRAITTFAVDQERYGFDAEGGINDAGKRSAQSWPPRVKQRDPLAISAHH